MRKYIIIFSILFLITIDALTKWFFAGIFQGMVFGCPNTPSSIGCDAMTDAALITRPFPILGDWLQIALTYNQGIAFGLPLRGIALQIVTIVLIIALLWYFIRYEYPKQKISLDIAFTLIIAGALAHAYERIFVGQVVDFIALKYFAIFNFADILITIGGCILVFYYFVYEGQRQSPR